MTLNTPIVLQPEQGQAFWFAGALMTLKVAGDQTDGRLAVLDQKTPPDYAVPLHVHRNEDEAWYVLEGDVTFFCQDERYQLGEGGWVFLPKLIPHTFKAGKAGARLLTLASPAGFADFVREAGEPATTRDIPPAAPLDMERLAAIASRFGVDLLGPPPA